MYEPRMNSFPLGVTAEWATSGRQYYLLFPVALWLFTRQMNTVDVLWYWLLTLHMSFFFNSLKAKEEICLYKRSDHRGQGRHISPAILHSTYNVLLCRYLHHVWCQHVYLKDTSHLLFWCSAGRRTPFVFYIFIWFIRNLTNVMFCQWISVVDTEKIFNFLCRESIYTHVEYDLIIFRISLCRLSYKQKIEVLCSQTVGNLAITQWE